MNKHDGLRPCPGIQPQRLCLRLLGLVLEISYSFFIVIIHYYYQLLIIHHAHSSGQSVALWDLSLGKQAWTYNGHGDQVRMISFYVGFV